MRLTPGDHIRAQRLGYYHHGIYVGDCQVVHFSYPPGNFWGARTLRQDDLKIFNNKRPAEIVSHVDALPRKEILERALAWSETSRGTFNLGANNCEHFANDCAVGKHYSHQAARVKTILFVTLLLVILAGVGIIGREKNP